MSAIEPPDRQCSLLIFLATSTEESALRKAAESKGVSFKQIRDELLGKYVWLGTVGKETVIAVPPARDMQGHAVMGAHGRLGSAARAIHFRQATAAQGIVQLGMAFGVNPEQQKIGDVLVGTALVPYDNRLVKPSSSGWIQRYFCNCSLYTTDYSPARLEYARPALEQLFRRHAVRHRGEFGVHIGTMLSGGARIGSTDFRDELVKAVDCGGLPVVGGEMEGLGLLAASTEPENSVWCIVKGISDFADSSRPTAADREKACSNAADFLLAALIEDAGII
jgi:adenosylhomocysteine nucleosidase